MGSRDVGLDVARGLLMAWIVTVIHGIFWLGVFPREPGSWLLFEMPPVFAITGAAYFLGEGAKHSKLTFSGYFDFLLRRGVRIYIPYLAYVAAAALLVTVVKWDGGLSTEQALARVWSWLNAVTRGAGHTWGMLSWHLWFVAPFMIVTALMPLIVVRNLPSFVRPWWLFVGAAIAVLGLAQISFPPPLDDQLIKNTAFYALWAVFGFMLAAAPTRWGIADYALVLLLATGAMAAAAGLQPQAVTLDMQHNKFPPNAVFFLFSCAWMAVFLIAGRLISKEWIEAIGRSPVVKPFISAGYSIYLWQGMGYTLAAAAGREFSLNIYVVWVIAVALTVALGLLASPLERIRLPRRVAG